MHRRLARRRLRPVAALVPLTLLLAAPAAAQFEEPPPPAAWALENATVVQPDGQRREGVTVVIRDGLVETLEVGADVPADARRLEGEPLFVYPGLVDAWGSADFAFPEPPDDEQVEPWNPSREVAGFTPRYRVADYLTATGESLAGRRAQGIVAQAVLPTDGFAPGQGSVILNRPEAETPRRLVLRPRLGPVLSFETARGAYPSTLFGVIAYLRQAFLDAERLGTVQTAWAEDPRGMEPPTWDPDLEVLRDAAAGRVPVFFAVDGAEDVRRVLGLADQFGFEPVIVGGGEAWKEAEELARRDVPVLVSLDFPEAEEWTPPDLGEEPGQQTAELEPGAARERERLENLYANAGRLAEAGVTFALTSGGGEAELREGTRRAIQYGLSEEDALAALTTDPATLLGVPVVARLETGLPANLVVTDGEMFGEDTGVLYTFVGGDFSPGAARREEGRGDPDAPTAEVGGEWEMTLRLQIQGQSMSFPLEVDIQQEGASFTGTTSSAQGEGEIRNGTITGNMVEFTLVRQAGEAEVSGVVEGDRITGSGSFGMGDFTFTATREPGVRGEDR